jgi:hypothetical protein
MSRVSLLFIFCILSIPFNVYSEGFTCEIDKDSALIKSGESVISKIETKDAISCMIAGENIFVARGVSGVDVYKITSDKKVERLSNLALPNEAIGFKMDGENISVITASFSYVLINKNADGSFSTASVAKEVFGQKVGVVAGATNKMAGQQKSTLEAKRVEGKVIEVTPGYAIIDLGSKDGIEKNMRIEILSMEPKKIYNIKTRTYEMMPSMESTAVSPVVQVSEDRCMIQIGRGNRVAVGDIALLTEKPLSESLYAPSYEKNLHRIYGRIAPFVGIETLTIGSLFSLMYDYTFSIPLKIEGGLRNAGILFSKSNTSPFQLDIIPSYNTDLFEVGLGGGYSYSGHKLKRNFTFLQKVRLGAVDGTNFTMWNSFIYQEKHSSWFSFDIAGSESGSEVKKVGDPCTPNKEREYEFAWNGFDIEASAPVSKSVNLFIHWAYSQAGWFTGEIGIKNFIRGNGGDGTIIIPVSIGGAAVVDYKSQTTSLLVCNPDTKRLEYEKDWNSEGFAGPIVSIGIDYRWK